MAQHTTTACHNITTQTIRGHVSDVASCEPMIGVSVIIVGIDNKGTITDEDGNFVIEQMPVGRHDIHAYRVEF